MLNIIQNGILHVDDSRCVVDLATHIPLGSKRTIKPADYHSRALDTATSQNLCLHKLCLRCFIEVSLRAVYIIEFACKHDEQENMNYFGIISTLT